MGISYTPTKENLFFPARNAVFFPDGRPKSEAALCAEMSRLAYARREPNFEFDQARIQQVLADIRFGECKFFEKPTDPQGQGSHGFLAIDNDSKLAVLAFRGTDSEDLSDLLDDANALPRAWGGMGNVHSGFAKALDEIWEQVLPALATVTGFRLLFTGHSLGAAMATLAASLHLPSVLYTIGSPRVGDTDFVFALAQKNLDSHRYVDCCDLVARIPPEGMLGYAHIGRPYYIDRTRMIQQRAADDPFIKKDQRRAKMQYFFRYAWRCGDVGMRSLADHTPLNYVWPVTADSP